MRVGSRAAHGAALTSGHGRKSQYRINQLKAVAVTAGQDPRGARWGSCERGCARRESTLHRTLSAEPSHWLALPWRPTYSVNEMVSNHSSTARGPNAFPFHASLRSRRILPLDPYAGFGRGPSRTDCATAFRPKAPTRCNDRHGDETVKVRDVCTVTLTPCSPLLLPPPSLELMPSTFLSKCM